MLDADRIRTSPTAFMTDLVYELLDAHSDTILLAGEADESDDWAAHLDYLRGLQRLGREVLARLDDPPS